MLRENNEKKIKEILSKYFKLGNYRLVWDDETWEMDIFYKKHLISLERIGYVYPYEHTTFKCVVIGGNPNPEIFREAAEELETCGFEVTIEKLNVV
ncbi:MAG: hypothetical protein PHG06_00405 [Parabacteroides sp.]|nr:hypothetical protein [Parabacteroides sp.]